MIKYLIIILIVFSSCRVPSVLPEPEYTPQQTEQIKNPNNIVIIQPPEDRRILNPHSFSTLIDKTFTFLSTALAIFFVEQAQ